MLYQQGTQRIEVIVRKEGGGANEQGAREEEATTTPNAQGEENSEGEGQGIKYGVSNRVLKRRIITNITHSAAVSKQMFNLGINYSMTGIGYATGDQAYQDRVQRQYEIINDTGSLASSAIMGSIYGAWGGPIGAVVGATLNTLSTASSLLVKYAGREREYDVKMFKENNAIEYNRARAGVNLTNGRLR